MTAGRTWYDAPAVDASDLGWPPGAWPASFIHDGNEWYLDRYEWVGDDLAGVVYVAYTATGERRVERRLIVAND